MEPNAYFDAVDDNMDQDLQLNIDRIYITELQRNNLKLFVYFLFCLLNDMSMRREQFKAV